MNQTKFTYRIERGENAVVHTGSATKVCIMICDHIDHQVLQQVSEYVKDTA